MVIIQFRNTVRRDVMVITVTSVLTIIRKIVDISIVWLMFYIIKEKRRG